MRSFSLFKAWVRAYDNKAVRLWLVDIDNKNEIIMQVPYNGDINRVYYICESSQTFPRTMNFIYKFVNYGGANNARNTSKQIQR